MNSSKTLIHNHRTINILWGAHYALWIKFCCFEIVSIFHVCYYSKILLYLLFVTTCAKEDIVHGDIFIFELKLKKDRKVTKSMIVCICTEFEIAMMIWSYYLSADSNIKNFIYIFDRVQVIFIYLIFSARLRQLRTRFIITR